MSEEGFFQSGGALGKARRLKKVTVFFSLSWIRRLKFLGGKGDHIFPFFLRHFSKREKEERRKREERKKERKREEEKENKARRDGREKKTMAARALLSVALLCASAAFLGADAASREEILKIEHSACRVDDNGLAVERFVKGFNITTTTGSGNDTVTTITVVNDTWYAVSPRINMNLGEHRIDNSVETDRSGFDDDNKKENLVTYRLEKGNYALFSYVPEAFTWAFVAMPAEKKLGDPKTDLKDIQFFVTVDECMDDLKKDSEPGCDWGKIENRDTKIDEWFVSFCSTRSCSPFLTPFFFPRPKKRLRCAQ
jgi:hypothetical protein